MTDLALLRTADPAAVRRLLETTRAEDLVAAIRSTPDDELVDLLGRDDVRPVAVEVILGRLHEYAVPDRVAALRGVVRFDLVRRDELLARHALVLGEGEMTLRRDPPADAPVDVVMTTSLLGFVRLVSGECNAGLAYLAGTLDIDGDAALAIGVGGIFRVPGTGRVAVDPTLLDPVDVATALAHARRGHLERVMVSGFRPVVLGEIFRRLPDFVDRRKAQGVRLSVGFRLLGNPTGDVDRYVVHVRDGLAWVEAGETAEEPDATVTCQGHDYLRLATGHLSPVLGVIKGSLKVKGDKAKALQLSSILDVPRAR